MPRKTYHHGDLKNALIKAGVDILAKEGVAGLSLRKVAQKAGVSHTAPYAHFTDKQALIAAISTEGFRMLYEQLTAVRMKYQDDPRRQLVEAAWAYVQFAQNEPAHFRVAFSSAVEHEKDYPALLEMIRKSYGEVVGDHAGVPGLRFTASRTGGCAGGERVEHRSRVRLAVDRGTDLAHRI